VSSNDAVLETLAGGRNVGCNLLLGDTSANRNERSGRNLIATKHALGHKYVNSTDAYLSFRQEEIDKLILAI